MDEFIHVLVTGLNSAGRGFCSHAAAMFLQVGLLVAVLLALDILLRRRVRATVRYWIWMLVFLKLLLPPTLSVPTGVGYWLGGHVPLAPVTSKPVPQWAEPQPARAGAAAETSVETPGLPGPASRPAAEPSASTLASHTHLAWQAVVFLLWGGGVLVLAGWMIQRLFFVRRLIAQSRPAPGEVLDLLDRCGRQMGVRHPVGLRLSSEALSPAVCGLRKPTILVPSVLLEKLPPERLRPVLIHELAHIERGDLWGNCLQTVLQILYFYNPLVWLASAIVRRVREQAVDERVLVALGAEAGSYGDTLIDIAEMAFLRAHSALGLIGVAESKKSLEGRIRHMVTRPMPTSARVGAWGSLIVLGIAAVLLPMAQAQNAAVPASQATAEQGTVAVLDGVTVELVGLCQNPAAKGQQWWRPDGTPMEEPEVRVRNPSKYPAVGFLLKFTPAKDVGYRSQTPLVRLPGSQVPIAPDGQAAVLYGSNSPLTEPWPNQADIEVDVAGGEWSTGKPITTRARRAGTGPLYRQTAQTPDGHDIILSGLRPNPREDEMSKTLIEVTTTATNVDICPECTTTDGRHLAGHFREGPLSSDGRLLQRTFGFAAAIEEMETIVVKQRPFRHVVFKNVSLQAGHRTTVGVETQQPQTQIPSAGTSLRANPEDAFQTYEVNRVVADFPPTGDMSTPEAAYATINRIDRNDPSAWQKVSVAALAEGFAREGGKRQNAADPEWAKVLLQARIREVVIWNMARAAVIAELPQGLSAKKVVQPIDVRSLQLENGRWLNKGNDRYESIEQAKAAFLKRIERQSAIQEAMRDPLAHAAEIKAAAAQLFERLRTADYADILSHYRDGILDAQGWKTFPTQGLYMVHTDYPSFALWCCTHFKDNPIVGVRLGEVFIGDTLVLDKTGWPTVPYRLTLKDGATLAGNLPFNYVINQGQGHWQGMEGIDWHLWARGTK